ncbi:hypothetical protein ACQPYK_22910 [Streptosporangium sp. CA-135522]|uniref:hypothetical protein n=1 Tax=Streptosporangium sp. CA-135522 TaxID=3240072 RepID=UPI003D94D3E9
MPSATARTGCATTLADANVPTGKIAEQGRWKPTSPTVHGYVRAVGRWKDNPMGRAGPQHPGTGTMNPPGEEIAPSVIGPARRRTR